MIVFVTTAAHGNTVESLVNGSFGAKLPEIGWVAWEALFEGEALRRATYIFTDMDRLTPVQLGLAAQIYRRALESGLRCLNDPARISYRYSLLCRLHEGGINPFRAYRAEALPRPERFPVFVRSEYDHGVPETGLLPGQAELDNALAELQARGIALRYLLVIEFCASPIAAGAWRKMGTFRLGAAMHVDHAVIEDRWFVKHGTMGLSTPEMFARERDEVAANACPEAVNDAFELAGIAYGRADHATVNGVEVVYEINTNPWIGPLTKQSSAVRDETMKIGRRRFGKLLAAVDTVDGRGLKNFPARLWKAVTKPS